MCRPKTPKVEKAIPPPSYIPESVNEEVSRVKDRERLRAKSAFGRQSTISQASSIAPTTQSKTLLGS